MKHITALSDSKYLIFGIALIHSLNETASIPITIHYFCIDDKSYDILRSLKLPNVVPYPPSELFNDENKQLVHIRQTDFQYLCWSLASVFTNHILMRNPDFDSVTYIDSDIYFHKDISILYEHFGEKECGIFRHRFLKPYEDSPYGKFNVGVVYFKNSSKGKEISNWWSDAVLHRKYPELATCGDQKYLDIFPRFCGAANIFIDDGIGHGAPWNWSEYDMSRIGDGIIVWRGQVQPLVFTHFSKFVYNIASNTFSPHNGVYAGYTRNMQVYNDNPALYAMHAAYFEKLKAANTDIQNAGKNSSGDDCV
jgi:hypothetical protein